MNAVEETRDGWVRFSIEVKIPLWQAPVVAAALTGNDDDIVLAAEKAMRARIEDDLDEASAELPAYTDLLDDRLELAVIEERVVKPFLEH